MKSLFAPLASLRLTIVLLALAMLLVYAGTWAQIDTGIWTVQKHYFHSFWTWIDFQTMLPRPAPGQPRLPGGFYMPGGYLIGTLMLVNLLAAHITRFKFTLKRSGIILIHIGLILLLVGEMLTSVLAVESQMIIDEGQTTRFSQDLRSGELAIIDPSSPESDTVVSFPDSMLKTGSVIRHPLVPFDIKVENYYANSQILGPMQAPPGSVSKATAGLGRSIVVQPQPQASGVEAQSVDIASAYLTLSSAGQNLGTYLVSYFFEGPQEVKVGDKTYLIALRFQRYYKPFSMHLIKFSHDRYLGTDVPKNFSSRVRLVDPQRGVDREVLIRMNEPLRYAGETYYQASFKSDDRTTILQVVHNPAWTMPYIACAVGALGMVIHFGMMLFGAIKKRGERALQAARADAAVQVGRGTRPGSSDSIRRNSPDESPSAGWADWTIPGLVLVAAIAALLIAVRPALPPKAPEFDFAGFGEIPVTFDGRVLPLDTLARTSLQAILGRQSTRIGPDSAKPSEWSKTSFSQWTAVPATRWLLDAFTSADAANEYRIFRIDNPDLIGLIGLDPDRSPRLFSFNEVMAKQEKLQEQITRAGNTEEKARDLFQRKIWQLYQHLQLFIRLTQPQSLYLVPPLNDKEQWRPIANMAPSASATNTPLADDALLGLLSDYRTGRADQFNARVNGYRALLHERLSADTRKAEFEAFFNRIDPFFLSQLFYIAVFVLGCASWLGWHKPLGRAAFVLLVISLIVHTFGLLARIYISGRPPVTNLYSSAVFIAWAGVVFAVGLELFYRNAIAAVMASAMGFTSLLIAHHLAGDGDTMRQMQAVLDTNFWLATHVVAITLGYASTFLAGVLAIAYVLLGVFTRFLTATKPGRSPEDAPAKILPRMVYAVLCFAILFSFVGTVLGGIWADQSWGRFWGWDPKENGAVLIVIWNALILHARWAGLVKQRGMMLLAIFGNVVTSWSWFGTNMLGVGLHSYGFMDSALFWLLAFVLSQLMLIATGFLPLKAWASFAVRNQPKLELSSAG